MYAEKSHFIPHDKSLDKIIHFGEDKGMLCGVIIALSGFIFSIIAFRIWSRSGFSRMEPEVLMRYVIPAATMIEIGIETVFASFLLGILRIEGKDDKYGN